LQEQNPQNEQVSHEDTLGKALSSQPSAISCKL